ncbi:hypothetical protein R1sor_002087 [Riccia sorocarpa]|uniref:Uncharacterized protein n=1 Tax=Riccia sorocarpa TaxID=122646 RepID=A0ABD3H0W7_9MARC
MKRAARNRITLKPKVEKPASKLVEKAKQRATPKKKPECRLLQVSITVGIVGEDISTETFDTLQVFVEKRAAVGLIALERGDATLQLHVQGVMAVESTSGRQIKSDLHVAIGWDTCCPDRAESVWRLATAPESTTLRDIDETFYGIKPSERYHTIHPMESILQHAREKEDAQEAEDLEKQLQDLETRIHTMAVSGSGMKLGNEKRIEHNSHGTRLQAVAKDASGKGPRHGETTIGGSRAKHSSKKLVTSLPTKSLTAAALPCTSRSQKLKRKAKSSSGIEPAIAWFDRAGDMRTTHIKSSQEPDVREHKDEIELGDYIPLVRDLDEEE